MTGDPISPPSCVPVARVIGAVFAVLSVPFLLIAIIMLMKEWAFQTNSITTQGVVVEFVKQIQTPDDEASREVFFPVFDFYDATKSARHFQSDIGSQHPNLRVGDTVDIQYSSGPFESVRLAGGIGMWIMGGVFAVAGFFSLTLGGILLFIPQKWIHRFAAMVVSKLRAQKDYADTTLGGE